MFTKEEKRKTLSEISLTIHGRVLRELLEEELILLNDVSTITSMEEVIGRQKGIAFIKKVLSFLETTQQTQQARNQYM